MWDMLLYLGYFLVGLTIGKRSPELEGKVSDLYSKLNESQDAEHLFHTKWLDAENRAESWKRRYDNLLLNTQTSKEHK
jgi:hypothetical protein